MNMYYFYFMSAIILEAPPTPLPSSEYRLDRIPNDIIVEVPSLECDDRFTHTSTDIVMESPTLEIDDILTEVPTVGLTFSNYGRVEAYMQR